MKKRSTWTIGIIIGLMVMFGVTYKGLFVSNDQSEILFVKYPWGTVNVYTTPNDWHPRLFGKTAKVPKSFTFGFSHERDVGDARDESYPTRFNDQVGRSYRFC